MRLSFTARPTSGIYTLSYTTLFRSLPLRGFRRRDDERLEVGLVAVAGLQVRREEIGRACGLFLQRIPGGGVVAVRSEEHTSELQSRLHIVCRLLLDKKNREQITHLP